MNDVARISPRIAATGAIGLLVGATIVLWSWNAVAAEVFGAPPMAFRQALALEAAVLLAGVVFGIGARMGIGRWRGAAP